MLCDLEHETVVESLPEKFYALCGVDGNGKTTAIITHCSDDDPVANKTACVDFGRPGEWEVYLVDAEHDGGLVEVTSQPVLDLKVHSMVLLKEKESLPAT